ncbi:MAG TPA: hypothetical protein VKA31_11345 [Mariprofundaceae bacterium]|nr:hypothetical protein [Mariprofundaceae bacterium]
MSWNLVDLSYDSLSIRPSQTPLTGGSLNAIAVADGGTRLYALNGASQLDQYDLSATDDISSAIFVDTFDPGLDTSNHPSSIWISCDGLTLWLNDNASGTGNNQMKEYTFGIAWDVTTLSLTNTVDLSGTTGTFSGYAWSWANDGAKFYSYGTFPNIYEFDASAAYDITSLSYTGNSFAINSVTGITYGTTFRVSNDGTKLITAQFSSPNRLMFELDFGTAYDITTINTTPADSYNLTADESFTTDSDLFCLAACVNKLWHVGEGAGSNNTPFIYQWDLGAQDTNEPCCGVAATCPSFTYVSGGVARLTTKEITGLWWFGTGCTPVYALVDGDVIQVEVCDGVVTLPRLAARAHIGLPYTADIETLNIEAPKGTIQGGRKKLTDVTLRFHKSRMPLIGPNFEDMVQIKQRENEAYGQPTALLTGDRVQNIPPKWNTHGRIAIRMKDPVPLTVLAVAPELEVEDDG